MLKQRYAEEIKLTRIEMNTFLSEVEQTTFQLKSDAFKLKEIISGRVTVPDLKMVRQYCCFKIMV